MIKKCEECTYFISPNAGYTGYCRRFPPNSEGKWAEVDERQWCGEFFAKRECSHPQCDDIHDAYGRATGKDADIFKQYIDGGISM